MANPVDFEGFRETLNQEKEKLASKIESYKDWFETYGIDIDNIHSIEQLNAITSRLEAQETAKALSLRKGHPCRKLAEAFLWLEETGDFQGFMKRFDEAIKSLNNYQEPKLHLVK